MDFGLSSVERYLPSSRLVYRQNKLPKMIIYLVPETLGISVCQIRVEIALHRKRAEYKTRHKACG